MYAKLNFSSTVTPAEMARDIARVLSESTGSGGATLGTCEFINPAESSISDTEASTWSLFSPASLNTGSATSTDKYIMKSPHAQSGKFKYVEVGYNGSSFSDSTNNGFRLMPVLDGGESTERLLGGYTSTNSTYIKYDTFHGTIHIVANSKCLLVFGRSKYTYIGAEVSHMSFLMESAVTTSSAYKTHAPYMYLNLYSHQNGHTTSYSSANDMSGPLTLTLTSWAQGGPGFFAIDMYDPVSTTRARAIQFQIDNTTPGWGGDVNDNPGWAAVRMNLDDGTTAGTNTVAPTGWYNVVGCHVGDLFAVHNYSLDGAYRRGIDSSGNPAMTLFPISILDPLMLCEFIDVSTSPVYMTFDDQGNFGDTLTISGDDYFYIPMSAQFATRGAYMVRLK